MKKKNEKILVSAIAGMTALQGFGSTMMGVSAHEDNLAQTHVAKVKQETSKKDNLEGQLHDTKQVVDERVRAEKKAEEAVGVAKQEVEVVQTDYDAQDQVVQQNYQVVYDAIMKELQPLMDEIHSLEAQIQEAKTDLDAKISASQKAAADLEEAQNTLAEKKSALEELQTKLETFGNVEDLTKELEEATNEKTAAEATVNEAQKHVDEANATLSNATQDVNDKQQAVDQATEEYNAALEDASKKQEIVKEKQDLVDSYNDENGFEKCEAELEQAKTDLDVANDNLEQAKEKVDAATAAYDEAVSSQQQAQQDYDAACQELANANTSLSQTQEALDKAQQKSEASQSQLESKNNEIVDLNTKIEGAQSDVDKAQSDYDKALNEYNSISSPVEQAQKKLSEFESKYATDLARLNQGSKGYFDSIGASDMADFVFDANCDNEARAHLASYTKMGQTDDATSLENMQASIAYLKECNEIRKQEGLSELKVSAWLMAIAQVNANYSKINVSHAGLYACAENLSWGYGYANTSGSPFRGWYDEEKADYLAGNPKHKTVAHYKNIVEPEFTVTGFALGTNGPHGMVHTQEFLDEVMGVDDEVQMSVSEFEQSFNHYYNNLKSVDAKHKALQNAVKNASGTTVKDDSSLKSAMALLNSKKDTLAGLQNQLAQANQAKKDLSNQVSTNQNRVSELKGSLQNVSDAVKQKESVKANKNEKLNEATKIVDSKRSEKEAKEKDFVATQKEQSTIQNKVDTLRDRLNNWDAYKEQAGVDFKSAKEDFEKANAQIGVSKTKLDQLKDEHSKAVEVQNEAQSKADEMLEILHQKQASLDTSMNRYNAAKQANDDYKNMVDGLERVKQELSDTSNRIETLKGEQQSLKTQIQEKTDQIQLLNEDLMKNKSEALPHQMLMNLLNETKANGSKVDLSSAQDEGLKNQMISLGKDVDALKEIQTKLDAAKKNYEDTYNVYMDAKSSRLDAETSYNKAMQELNAFLMQKTETEPKKDIVKTSVQTNSDSVNTGVETKAFIPMMASMLAALGVIGVVNKKRKEED